MNLFRELDSHSGKNSKREIYLEDIKLPIIYLTDIGGGRFQDIKTERMFSFDDGISVLREYCNDEILKYGIIETLDNFPEPDSELKVCLVKETGKVIIESDYRRALASMNETEMEAIFNFNTMVEQSLIYNEKINKSGSVIGSLAKTFEGIVLSPTRLGEFSLNSLTSNVHTLDSFSNYEYRMSAKPKPVYMTANGIIYGGEVDDNDRYTRVYRTCDIVNYFAGAGLTDADKKSFNENLPALNLVLCSHYNRSISEGRGFLIMAKNPSCLSYIPYNPNIKVQSYVEALRDIYTRKEFSVQVHEVEYLDFLYSKIGARSMNLEKFKELFKGWDFEY